MSDPQLSAPRISAPYLDSCVGQHVMLVGKLTQLRGDQATLDSDGTVTVLLNRASLLYAPMSYLKQATYQLTYPKDSHLANGSAAQVIGKVNPDLSIKVLTSQNLGPGVDIPLYLSVVDAVQRHRDVFVQGS